MKPASRPFILVLLKPRVLVPALLCLASLCWTGCRLVRTTVSVPGRTVGAIFPGGKSNQPDPADLQESLMRFADAYAARTIESVDELTEVPGSSFTQHSALRFKISCVGGVITIASGANPYANLVDMAALTTLTRMVLENHWVTRTNGAMFELWLSRSRSLETNIWMIADQVLSRLQQDELRSVIQQHYASLVELQGGENLFLMHPQDLLLTRSLAAQRSRSSGSVLGLAALDPLAGLDPAVREITETRLFAARALYTIQRMPWLVRWHSELLLLDATSQPQVAQALNDVTRLSESVNRASTAAESISQTAAALPAQITGERQAIVEALEAQEGRVTTMLQTGTEFSDSLNTTVTNFNALMKRFGVGEPNTNPAPAEASGPPFNILDYAKTAEQITAMAQQLNEAMQQLHTTLDSPVLHQLSSQATADARSLLNHAFLLAAGLVVLLFVCALLYRALAARQGKP